MRFRTILKTVLLGAVATVCMAPASAQQVQYFPDFSTGTSNLQMNGSAHITTFHSAKVLRLTDGAGRGGPAHPETGSTWFKIPDPNPYLGQQVVNSGFTTYFKFQIDTAGICCTPGDGFAFVIQTASSTALGSGFGGIGYAGIPNSLAVEFDTFQNTNFSDPNANHVAVQGCGNNPNSPDHNLPINGGCLVGTGINSSTIPHLGVTCSTSSCADGVSHEVVIEYDPPTTGIGNGTLTVYIDQPFIPFTHTPCPNTTTPGCPVAAVAAINIPYNIDNGQNPQGISLRGGTSGWVGFTADQPNIPEAHDILAWEFTPHAPAQVTQVIPPGGTEADYVFGGHHMGVTEACNPNSFCFKNDPNNPISMTVVATPVPRQQVYQRIKPFFPNEQCVVYLQTGGNCIVYSVTCQDNNGPVMCPVAPDCNTLGDFVNCITFNTSFYTADPITQQNADYLKADPALMNLFFQQSIFVSYDPNVFDGKTTGTGGSSSDFVATFQVRQHN